MNKFFHLVIIFCCLISDFIYSQNTRYLDSLQQIIDKHNCDTNEVLALNFYAWEVKLSDQVLSTSYAKKAICLAEKLNFINGQAGGYNTLGGQQYLIQNYDKALIYYNKTLKLFIKAGNKKGQASVFNNIALINNERGNYDLSLESHLKALQIRREMKDEKEIATAYNNIGNLFSQKGDYDSASVYLINAIKIYEKGQNKSGLSAAYYNMGALQLYQHNFDKAFDYCEKSLKIREEIDDKFGIAYCYILKGGIYEEQGEYEKATENYKKSLVKEKELNDIHGEATLLMNLGNIANRTGKYDEACEYFKEASVLCEKMGNKKLKIQLLLNLADTRYNQSKFNEAVKIYKQAYYLAINNGNKDEIKKASLGASLTFASIKDYKNAYEFQSISFQMKDSLFNEEKMKQMSEMESKYQSEKKQQQIELQKTQIEKKEVEVKQQTTQKYAFILGFLLMLFLSVVIFKSLRDKKRANMILQQQNEEIEAQRDEIEAQRDIVVQQKEHIEEIHKDLTDSINYAERIQRSFLATKEILNENLHEHFVFFHPKDVVSGDFYWASKLSNGNFALATADSTGHGVPGAIMSILNISSLEKAIEQNLCEPSEILNSTRKTIIERLKKDGSPEGGKDGMDASLICLDSTNHKFTYSSANNPIWVIRENNLIELHPDKMPIGKNDKDQILFTQNEFQLQKGDVVYTLTDGLPDQFGGPKGKKFKYAALKDLLISINSQTMTEQKQILEETLKSWKGDLEQVDDITIIGIRI